MTKTSATRIRGHQPPLPLVEPDPSAIADRPSRSIDPADSDSDWRLDEHTRMVGRMGIAAARARLRSSSQPTSGQTPPHSVDGNPTPGHKHPGRAA